MKKRVLGLTAVFGVGSASAAFALPTPTPGSLGYDAYDIIVVQGMKGPIGFAIAALLIAIGAYEFRKSPLIGIAALAGAGIAIKADAIVTTLGAII